MRLLRITDNSTSRVFIFNIEDISMEFIDNQKLVVYTKQGYYYDFNNIAVAPSDRCTILECESEIFGGADIASNLTCHTSYKFKIRG